MALTLALAALGAGEEAPEDVLAGLGLKRAGATYVLKEKEAEAQAKWKEAQELARPLKAALAQQAEVEQAAAMVPQLDAQQQQVRGAINALNAQTRTMGRYRGMARYQINGERAQLQQQWNAINQQTAALKRSLPSAAARKDLEGRIASARDAYARAIGEVRAAVDAAVTAYSQLADDEAVKAALGEVGRKAHVNERLGPSKEFRNLVRHLEAAEKELRGAPQGSGSSSGRKGKSRGKR